MTGSGRLTVDQSVIKSTHYCSKRVTSNQSDVHERLEKLVLKHIQHVYKKPYQKHNIDAFHLFQNKLSKISYERLILDSCCGTAMSSINLAINDPNSLVVAIDQSFKRLNKNYIGNYIPDNCLLLRANCEDFWRICVENKIVFDKHYILYPNPWPKSVHLLRRWHGHSVFPYLNRLAQTTLLRSNWKIYLDEFQIAWKLLTNTVGKVNQFEVEKPLTLFEKKYLLSGQKLYQLILEK